MQAALTEQSKCGAVAVTMKKDSAQVLQRREAEVQDGATKDKDAIVALQLEDSIVKLERQIATTKALKKSCELQKMTDILGKIIKSDSMPASKKCEGLSALTSEMTDRFYNPKTRIDSQMYIPAKTIAVVPAILQMKLQQAVLAVLLEECKQIQAQLSEQAIQLDAPPSLVECPHCGEFGAPIAHVEGCAVALRRTTCRNGLHAKGFPQVPAGHEGAAGF